MGINSPENTKRINELLLNEARAQRDAAEKRFVQIRSENDDLQEEIKDASRQRELMERLHGQRIDRLADEVSSWRRAALVGYFFLTLSVAEMIAVITIYT